MDGTSTGGRLALMQSRLHDMSALVKAGFFFRGRNLGRFLCQENHQSQRTHWMVEPEKKILSI